MSADRREASERLTDKRKLFQIRRALEKAQIRDLAHNDLRAVYAACAVFIEADVFNAVSHHVPAEMQLCDLRELPAVDRLVRYPERAPDAALGLFIRKADGKESLGLAEIDYRRSCDGNAAFSGQLLRDLRRRHGIPFPARQRAERSRGSEEEQQRRGQTESPPGDALKQRAVIAPRQEAGAQDRVGAFLRRVEQRDDRLVMNQLLPALVRPGILKTDHQDVLAHTHGGTHLAVTVLRFHRALRQEEEYALTVLHMLGDIGRPVASRGDALVVPKAVSLFMQDHDRVDHRVRLSMGIADEKEGARALIRLEEAAHAPSPPLSSIV